MGPCLMDCGSFHGYCGAAGVIAGQRHWRGAREQDI